LTRRKQLEKKLDAVFRDYILLRGGGVCFCCGVSGEMAVLQCGHLITRARRAVRWDERNAEIQCRTDNFLHEHRPELFTRLWILKYGEAAYDKLIRDSWTDKKYSLQELEDLIEYYKNKRGTA
jgi:hypothetical protein